MEEPVCERQWPQDFYIVGVIVYSAVGRAWQGADLKSGSAEQACCFTVHSSGFSGDMARFPQSHSLMESFYGPERFPSGTHYSFR